MWIFTGLALLVYLVGICYRLPLISKTTILADETQLPEWEAWRISAIEPLVTTTATVAWGIGILVAEWAISISEIIEWISLSVYIVPQLSILFFAGRIWHFGNKNQRGRLALIVLLIRFIILVPFSIPSLRLLQNIEYPLLLALGILMLVRSLFAIYQHWVAIKTEKKIRPEYFAIDDGVDLWHEDAGVIERLKAEEEMVAGLSHDYT